MRELNPKSLRRVLRLRQFPLFETADLDELATIAENLVDTRIHEGSVIASAGARLQGVQLILDGTIETRPHGQSWGPHQVFGALEVFANRRVAHTAVAATDLHTLQLSAVEIGEVLEDNFGVLLATLRTLASRVLAVAPSSRAVKVPATDAPLGFVERLILLRQLLPFTGARLQALTTLAHASDEIIWPAGTVVVQAGDPATSAFVIIDGVARADRDDSSELLDVAAQVGYLETLAGVQHTATIEITETTRALRSGAPAIFDVLEDHAEAGLAMMATFASTLLDATPRLN